MTDSGVSFLFLINVKDSCDNFTRIPTFSSSPSQTSFCCYCSSLCLLGCRHSSGDVHCIYGVHTQPYCCEFCVFQDQKQHRYYHSSYSPMWKDRNLLKSRWRHAPFFPEGSGENPFFLIQMDGRILFHVTDNCGTNFLIIN